MTLYNYFRLFYGIIYIFCIQLEAQELFVMTEPASNMPAGSIGVRSMNSFMFEKNENINYHLMPELMWGINKNWMLHVQSFQSNSVQSLKFEGASLYTKYRFLSVDDLHKHFRIASFARISYNNADIHQESIETMGHNSGFEVGLVATQLIKKVAISSNLSIEKATNFANNLYFNSLKSKNALNYSLSIGKLIYPKNYKNFKQTNINFMLEFLGQTLENKKSSLDIVPSIQFIINSQARIDLAYRRQIYSSIFVSAPNGFLVKIEYTFFKVKK